MVKGLPSNYMFFLKCCYSPGCKHPICSTSNVKISNWYKGGPPLSYLPFPIPDPNKPVGHKCSSCGDTCHGHYLSPKEALYSELSPMIFPPSYYLKNKYDLLQGNMSEADVLDISREVLLPPEEVKMWFDHLETVKDNRKRGAEKAAATRKRQKNGDPLIPLYYCGVCGDLFESLADDVQDWIQCDGCDNWYHFTCVGVTAPTVPETFNCGSCLKNPGMFDNSCTS